jgi:L-aminopeptidase/D-esterase-like protein
VTTAPDLTRFGLAVGHATDEAGATGLTVIRGIQEPLRAGAAVFGRATGSREFLAASPDHLVEGRVDAIVLTGGSAYGLDAVAGVMRWMEERGRGFPVGPGVVPIVPAAVVYDLAPLGEFSARPTAEMAYDATNQAAPTGFSEGSIGVGAGTTVGKLLGRASSMKGGFGCAIAESDDGELSAAALVGVNAYGDVRDASGAIIAGVRTSTGGFGDTVRMLASTKTRGLHAQPLENMAMQNTTIAVVASSVALSSVELTRVARASGAALFRRITPAASAVDGDTIFAVSPLLPHGRPVNPMIIETLAVQALERAIERAVRLAKGRDGIPGLGDGDGT